MRLINPNGDPQLSEVQILLSTLCNLLLDKGIVTQEELGIDIALEAGEVNISDQQIIEAPTPKEQREVYIQLTTPLKSNTIESSDKDG